MNIVLVVFTFLVSVSAVAQDTIYTESKIEIINREIPEIDSKYARYYSLEAFTHQGAQVFKELHEMDFFGTYFSEITDNSKNQIILCHGGDDYMMCSKTVRDTILNIEYDYHDGDTVAIRKLSFDQSKLTKSECIYGCEYFIHYSYNGDTLTEFKQINDSTHTYSYSIFDKKDRLTFHVWGSQKPIFEGYYYFDTYKWDDENRTCLKQTSASNSTPYYTEKTFYDNHWIPLRKEVAYAKKSEGFDNYTIRYSRDVDSVVSMNALPENWIRLTETDSGKIIFNHCAGGNYKISIIEKDGKKSLLEHGQQEDSEYWIKEVTLEQNKLVFSVEFKLDGREGVFTFQWVDQVKGVGRWTSNISNFGERGELLVFENFRNHFPIVDQPCVECWGDECDE